MLVFLLSLAWGLDQRTIIFQLYGFHCMPYAYRDLKYGVSLRLRTLEAMGSRLGGPG